MCVCVCVCVIARIKLWVGAAGISRLLMRARVQEPCTISVASIVRDTAWRRACPTHSLGSKNNQITKQHARRLPSFSRFTRPTPKQTTRPSFAIIFAVTHAPHLLIASSVLSQLLCYTTPPHLFFSSSVYENFLRLSPTRHPHTFSFHLRSMKTFFVFPLLQSW